MKPRAAPDVPEPNLNYLRIPLYGLLFHRAIDPERDLNRDIVEHYSTYEPEHLAGIIDSLEWAADNPGHDFRSMLPSMRLSNTELHAYLSQLHDLLVHRFRGAPYR